MREIYKLPVILLNGSDSAPSSMSYDFLIGHDFEGKDVLLLRE
jgi:hypothetical protein